LKRMGGKDTFSGTHHPDSRKAELDVDKDKESHREVTRGVG